MGHSRQQCRKQILKHFQQSTINQYYNLWHSVCSKQFWLNLSGFYLKFKENLSIFFPIQQISNFGSYGHSKQKGGVLRRCSIWVSDFLQFQIFSVRFSNLPAAKDSFFLTRNRKYFVITSVYVTSLRRPQCKYFFDISHLQELWIFRMYNIGFLLLFIFFKDFTFCV